MGIRRYSLDSDQRRWEETFDWLQKLCHFEYQSPAIREITGHGVTRAFWQCRGVGWRDDGRGECWHGTSKTPFDLTELNPSLRVAELRRRYVCSRCGRKRPYLQLIAT